MIILDTSIWIEFLKKNPDYFPIITPLLEEQEILAAECVFGELLHGYSPYDFQALCLLSVKYAKTLSST